MNMAIYKPEESSMTTGIHLTAGAGTYGAVERDGHHVLALSTVPLVRKISMMVMNSNAD
jgi:hypothetical protein